MALHRGDQAKRHLGRHGPGPGAVPRSDPERFDLRPGLLRTGRQHPRIVARRGRGTGPPRFPARHREQVVPPVLRAGIDYVQPPRRSAESLPPPAGERPQGPGQLPHRGGPLRAETIAFHGPRDTRFGGAALRPHTAAERHETAYAGGYEPDRQSRRRSPRDGRSRPLRGAAPHRAGRPLRRRRQGFAGPRRVRPGVADRLHERSGADGAGRFPHRTAGLPVAAGRHPEALSLGRRAARDEDQTLRTVHLRHTLLPRILFPTQRLGFDPRHPLSRGQARRGALRRPSDRLGRTGAGPRALQEPPRGPTAGGGFLPVGDRHRNLPPAPRLGGEIRHPGLGALPRQDRLPHLERACDEQFETVRTGGQSLQGVAPLCRHRFAAGRDLGHDRRHMAPAGRRGTPRVGREPCGQRGPFGSLPQSHEGVLQSLRAQLGIPSRQPDGAQQLRLFPLAGGAGPRAGALDVEPRGGAHRQQPDLSGHPCVGALQAGTHGRSQKGPAKGRGARRTEKPRTDGSLRRYPPRAGRTVHGRSLLETRS